MTADTQNTKRTTVEALHAAADQIRTLPQLLQDHVDVSVHGDYVSLNWRNADEALTRAVIETFAGDNWRITDHFMYRHPRDGVITSVWIWFAQAAPVMPSFDPNAILAEVSA